jgi:hypothetical protein
MHMLAVGFEVLALATFVKNFDRRRGGAAYGAATGVWLALAALTTPRSYPFIFAFVCAGVTPSIFGTARRAIRYRFGMAMAVFAGAMIAWAFASHGGVVPWARYLAYIFTHEDTDVAVLPTAVRTFSFHWSGVLTPLAVIAFGVAAAWAIGRRPPMRQTVGEDAGRAASRDGALAFLIACAWIALITTAVVLNYTFFNGEYIALPMLAVLVAWPWSALPFSRRTAAIAAGTLMCLQLSLLAYRYTCLTVRWQAQEPEAINAFVQQFVPPGSTVAGPEAPYFFPVERAGSRYRTVSPRSWADWARWVPIIEPEATRLAARTSYEIPTRRFLIWPAQDDLPDGYACAAGSVVAQYQAAEASGRWPDWLVTLAARFPGYPSCVLYRLPPGCPMGYDPTMPPGAVSR